MNTHMTNGHINALETFIFLVFCEQDQTALHVSHTYLETKSEE